MFKEETPKVFHAALYLRLSREDGDKVESNSVKNQRDLILFYLKDKKDILVVTEKIDDGYSGVTFDRPALKELLEEIKMGTINCVIVKDLSRFGRNYIEAGRYIEQIFPFLGVRFIAINDNIDTARDNTQSNSIIVPFKNLMNDAYSRDISIKARSQLEIRQKQGDFVGAFPVYGYVRSKEDKHKLEVDETAAATIKEIFSMRMTGYNNCFIANYLNCFGVPSPLEYKKMQDSKYNTSFQLNPVPRWSPMAVDRILKNEIYTGSMLQGKETTVSYKIKKRIRKPKIDWICVENTHEAIIPKEDFEAVQGMMINDTRTAPKNEKLYLLSGLLECGECGSNMVRKIVKARGKTYAYYICSKNKANKNECSSHRIREDLTEKTLLNLFQQHIGIFCKLSEEMKSLDFFQENEKEKQKLHRQLNLKKDEIRKYEGLKMSLYEDYQADVLTNDEYLELKEAYQKICTDVQGHIDVIMDKMQGTLHEKDAHNAWVEDFKKQQNISELSRTTLALLAEKIMILDGNTIKVVLNYADGFEEAMKHFETRTGFIR